jgi:hypothetical protein
MSQPCGGLSSAAGCHVVTFPQVTVLSNVGWCRGELTLLGLFVPTLCPPGLTPSPYQANAIQRPTRPDSKANAASRTSCSSRRFRISITVPSKRFQLIPCEAAPRRPAESGLAWRAGRGHCGAVQQRHLFEVASRERLIGGHAHQADPYVLLGRSDARAHRHNMHECHLKCPVLEVVGRPRIRQVRTARGSHIPFHCSSMLPSGILEFDDMAHGGSTVLVDESLDLDRSDRLGHS